jgi:hypothetical protein
MELMNEMLSNNPEIRQMFNSDMWINRIEKHFPGQ